MTQKIVVEELRGSALTQNFSFTDGEVRNVYSIRPFLYVHNASSVSGTFTFSIKDSGGTIESKTFTAANVKTAMGTSNEYMASWYEINFTDNVSLKGGETYTFELSSSGYTFSESAYIGWIKEHEFRHNDLDYTPIGIAQSPMACQCFVYRSPESL